MPAAEWKQTKIKRGHRLIYESDHLVRERSKENSSEKIVQIYPLKLWIMKMTDSEAVVCEEF